MEYSALRVVYCLRKALPQIRRRMSSAPSPRVTVWYNTRRPVCDAGIDRQRNRLLGNTLLAAVKAGSIAFRDINLEPDALARDGTSHSLRSPPEL